MAQPTMTEEVRASQPLTTEDRFGIFDLFARYAWAYDCGDAQAYAETFTTDGVLADENDLRAVGRPAIAEAIKTFFDMRGLDVWQHHNDHLHIQGDGAQCTVHSYWAVLAHRRSDDGFGVSTLGWYISRCRKVDGVWLFAERTFYMDMPKGLPWTR
jgi:ketosteroid isomerase-like protein